jgi:sugar O-acyltransferase (sialic acid O-acetyltransferase NeuD family)
MNKKDQNKKLLLVGHSEGGAGVVMDLANELFGIGEFDLVKNVDFPDCDFSPDLYHIKHYFDHEYDFENNQDLKVQFGVQHSNIKSILFEHFLKYASIGKNRYLSILHQSSYVAQSAQFGEGLLLEPLAVISSYSKLGFGVSVKRSASVGHHAELGDFVNINPGATLSGFVSVGEGTEIGSGAVISNNISIGKRCLIGAGSVVTRDVPDGVIAYGNPCKVIRDNERWAKVERGDFSVKKPQK